MAGAQPAARRSQRRIRRSSRVRPNGLEDTPQFKRRHRSREGRRAGLSMADINSTLSSAWGSAYVNDFIDHGRVKKVYMQADAPYPHAARGPGPLVRAQRAGRDGAVLAFARGKWTTARRGWSATTACRRSRSQGQAAPGFSSGEAMASDGAALQRSCPPGIGYRVDRACRCEERLSGAQAPLLYALSLLVVFLCLAALYESWSIPFSVHAGRAARRARRAARRDAAAGWRTTCTSRSAC